MTTETIVYSHPVKTAKVHSCHGCCGVIPKGSKAFSYTGKCNGTMLTFWNCESCDAFIRAPENAYAVQEACKWENTAEGWVAENKAENDASEKPSKP